MGAFTPFKRHANKFNYTPRYYDPAREAREQRRAELTGQVRDEAQGEEYRPGEYIRRQGAARATRRGGSKRPSALRMWMYVAAIFAVFFLGSMLYSKLLDMFVPSEGARQEMEQVEEEFNPYAPIIVVPNDYVEPTNE